ncbi:transcriptional repressor [Candidatus Atribacteria bacterium RBG_19FT_COMBO_35_14]|uniref:Transcriptional repressor n=1 Tax=Candidatus Sediminicultor quintus TaxID=1797291 RepID=A0A1F5AFW0_9BACT|nr:MAG: transcriptional repressor [Candidatus Atribacteria bacterium RBG_19FT_COMBO_35_14]
MELLFKDLSAELKNRRIHPSYQRIKVLDYLNKNQCHPTVDQIFKDLQREIPTLSKSTIYNTLNLFLKSGLIKVINIENNDAHYDIITKNHGHFKCESCGKIFNFSIDLNTFTTEELSGFKIIDKNVYFKGICPRCL